MSNTIRNLQHAGWIRHPKRNGAVKGEVRNRAIPPNTYDDLPLSAQSEDYSYRTLHWDICENWGERGASQSVQDADEKARQAQKRIRRERRERRIEKMQHLAETLYYDGE